MPPQARGPCSLRRLATPPALRRPLCAVECKGPPQHQERSSSHPSPSCPVLCPCAKLRQPPPCRRTAGQLVRCPRHWPFHLLHVTAVEILPLSPGSPPACRHTHATTPGHAASSFARRWPSTAWWWPSSCRPRLSTCRPTRRGSTAAPPCSPATPSLGRASRAALPTWSAGGWAGAVAGLVIAGAQGVCQGGGIGWLVLSPGLPGVVVDPVVAAGWLVRLPHFPATPLPG